MSKFTIALFLTILVLQCLPSSEAKSIKKKAAEVFNKMVAKFKEKVNALRQDAKAFFKKAKESLKTGIVSIKDKAKKLKDKAVKIMFEGIYNNLEKARKKLKETNELADEKFYKAMDKAHEKFFTVTSQIEKFMQKQKEILEKKQEKEKGLEILDNFVIKSSEKIESCSEAALGPVKELYEQTKGVINRAIDDMEAIIKKSVQCMAETLQIMNCAKSISEDTKSHLSSIVDELKEVKTKLLGVVMGEIANFVCIGKTRAEVEFDKLSVGKQIESLK